MPRRLLYVKALSKWMLVLAAAALLLVACDADQDSPEVEREPEAVLAAQEALASELDVDLQSVTIESYEQVEWSDSCLGLGGPAESCLAAPYPGWRVMLSVDGATYEVRTNETAKIIRIDE